MSIEDLVELDIVGVLRILVVVVLGDEVGVEVVVASGRRGEVGLGLRRNVVVVVVDVDAVDVLLDGLSEVLLGTEVLGVKFEFVALFVLGLLSNLELLTLGLLAVVLYLLAAVLYLLAAVLGLLAAVLYLLAARLHPLPAHRFNLLPVNRFNLLPAAHLDLLPAHLLGNLLALVLGLPPAHILLCLPPAHMLLGLPAAHTLPPFTLVVTRVHLALLLRKPLPDELHLLVQHLNLLNLRVAKLGQRVRARVERHLGLLRLLLGQQVAQLLLQRAVGHTGLLELELVVVGQLRRLQLPLLLLEHVAAASLHVVLPPLPHLLQQPLHPALVPRLENHHRRHEHLQVPLHTYPDVVQLRLVVDPQLLQVAHHRPQHSPQVRREQQVRQSRVRLRLLRQCQQAEVHHLVVKTVLSACIYPLPRIALHYFPNPDDVGVVQSHDLLKFEWVQGDLDHSLESSGSVCGRVGERIRLVVECLHGGLNVRRTSGRPVVGYKQQKMVRDKLERGGKGQGACQEEQLWVKVKCILKEFKVLETCNIKQMNKSNKVYYQQAKPNVTEELCKINSRLDQLINSNQVIAQMVSELLRNHNYSQQNILRNPIQNDYSTLSKRFSEDSEQQVHDSSAFPIHNPEKSVLDSPLRRNLSYSHEQNSSMDITNENQEVNNSLIDMDYNHESEDFLQRVEEEFGNKQQLRSQSISQKHQVAQLPASLILGNQISEEVQMSNCSKLLKLLQQEFTKMSLKFSECHKLYLYPQMSNQSFYDKITDQSNILLMTQLKNGEVFGAFTEVGFSSKPTHIPKDNPKCCLFNLTRRRYLYASRTNKTHSCDKSYILFGNWEIKLKVGENVLYTDLGSRGDCFTKQGFGPNQPQIPYTRAREWIFGQGSSANTYQLERYMVCALK